MWPDNLNELFAAFLRELEAAPRFGTLALEVVIRDGQVVRAEVVKRRTYLVPEDTLPESGKGRSR